MADYVLSNKADGDLTEIYLYSHRTYGEAKADAYFLSLCDFLRALADNPRLGRAADYIRPGLFCHRSCEIKAGDLGNEGVAKLRDPHDAILPTRVRTRQNMSASPGDQPAHSAPPSRWQPRLRPIEKNGLPGRAA